MRATWATLTFVTIVGGAAVASHTAFAGRKSTASADPAPPDFATFETVPYAKFTNTAFAADFEGKWIKVDCSFAASAASSYDAAPMVARSQGLASESDVFFMINRPGAPAGETVSNPLAGQMPAGYNGVYMSKESSDPLFTLVPGQNVTIYGLGKKYSLGTGGMNAAATNIAVLKVLKIEVTPPPPAP